MIQIKAVDAQNILAVCELTTNQDCIGAAQKHSCCNAISIAEANYHLELHPNAIYNNNVLIGFFMYERTEHQAETATIRRFMIDDRFQQKGLEEKAFAHILRGLKIQGVKTVILRINDANPIAKNRCLSFGFQFTEKIDPDECCYTLKL